MTTIAPSHIYVSIYYLRLVANESVGVRRFLRGIRRTARTLATS